MCEIQLFWESNYSNALIIPAHMTPNINNINNLRTR